MPKELLEALQSPGAAYVIIALLIFMIFSILDKQNKRDDRISEMQEVQRKEQIALTKKVVAAMERNNTVVDSVVNMGKGQQRQTDIIIRLIREKLK